MFTNQRLVNDALSQRRDGTVLILLGRIESWIWAAGLGGAILLGGRLEVQVN